MPAANSWEGVQEIPLQKTCYIFVEMFIGDSAFDCMDITSTFGRERKLIFWLFYLTAICRT